MNDNASRNMHIYACVCVCAVCAYICAYVSVCVCVCVRVCKHQTLHTQPPSVCVHTLHTHIYVCICMHTHTFMYIYTQPSYVQEFCVSIQLESSHTQASVQFINKYAHVMYRPSSASDLAYTHTYIHMCTSTHCWYLYKQS